jgi:phenylalanyl-tRNA synthetase beta chain
MKCSARWLRDMVPGLDLSPEQIADRLALRGAPVESIVWPGASLGDVVVAKVLTTARHPNADRLTLCTVDGGAGVVNVVCGAPNVRAEGWYPFAPVGATLPGGLAIKKAKIRGETSEGMLCSAKELGLGGDHSGLLTLEGTYEPGESFVSALGLDDATLDVETTVNRGDLLSHLGVARELASAEGKELVLPELAHASRVTVTYSEGAPEVRVGPVSVRIDDADLCQRYLGAVIRGIRIQPSPAWLQERLRGAGARPINNVVDATNYVMLELGQPLHAFDLGRLGGSAIVVR